MARAGVGVLFTWLEAPPEGAGAMGSSPGFVPFRVPDATLLAPQAIPNMQGRALQTQILGTIQNARGSGMISLTNTRFVLDQQQ